MSFYAVVEFTEEEGDTAVVSSTWLRDNDKLCRWPSGPNCNFAKLAANHAKVDDRWTLHPCNVLKTYSTFEKAQRGCTKSVYTSNIESSTAEITPNADLSRRKRRRVTTNRKPVKLTSPLRFSTTTSKTRSSSSSASSGFDMNHEIIGCPTNSLLNRPVPSLGSRQKINTALEVEPPRLGLVDPTNYTGNDPQIELSNIKLSRSPVQTTTFQLPIDRQLKYQAQNTLPYTSTKRQLNSERRSFESEVAPSSSQIDSVSSQIFRRDPPPDDVTSGQTHSPNKQSSAEERFGYESTPTSRYTQGYPGQTSFEPLTGGREDNVFQKTVLQYLVKIVDNQNELLRRAGDVSKNNSSTCILPVQLPINTISEYQALNQWLTAPLNTQSFTIELSIIGGNSISSITTRVLSYLISNQLARKLSLTGIGKKTEAGIKGNPILTLIYGIVRLTKGGESATNSEIDSAIQKWLKGAPDRDGGRKERRLKTGLDHNQDGLNEQGVGDG